MILREIPINRLFSAKRGRFRYLTASLVFFAGALHAASPGADSFSFLNISPYARSAALADATSAYVGDTFSVYSNPAGLAHLQEKSASINHVSHFQGVAYDNLTYIMPYGRGGVGASLGYLRYSDIPKTTFNPSATATGADRFTQSGDIDAGDYAASVAWGFRHNSNLALGANFKLVQETLDTKSSVAALFDAGGIYRFPLYRQWRAAAVLQNVGYATKFISETPDVPTRLRGGLFYSPEMWADWSGELVYNLHGNPEVALGGEFSWQQTAFLRAGYRYGFRDAKLGGLTGASLGVGLKAGSFRLDYAFLPFGDLGDSHRISLGWSFGSPRTGRAAAELKRPIAVSEFEAENVSLEDARTAAGYLRMELERSSPFRVMNVYEMRGTLARKAFSPASCPSPDCAVRMGRALNVDKLIVCSLARRNEGFFITGDLVDVGTGTVERQETIAIASADQLPTASRDLAKRFFPPVVR